MRDVEDAVERRPRTNHPDLHNTVRREGSLEILRRVTGVQSR